VTKFTITAHDHHIDIQISPHNYQYQYIFVAGIVSANIDIFRSCAGNLKNALATSSLNAVLVEELIFGKMNKIFCSYFAKDATYF